MSEDLKAQLTVSADVAGVEVGAGKIKRTLNDLGTSAVEAGNKAGEAVANIGRGGDTAAKNVEAATRSMIGSIQRTTAVLESGSRTNAKYFETLANQRGIPLTALRPYLDQLDQVNAKTKMAVAARQELTTSLGATGYQKPLGNLTSSLGASGFGELPAEAARASAVGSAALGSLTMSAKATNAALRGVPAQFTDIFTSLQGGQAPLTVFLQQGGQLKDMFGGAGPAARALGGYIGGLINPFTLTAAAVAALTYAYYVGSQEQARYAKAIILTGNAAGTTKTELADMARELGQGNITQGQAASALAAIAGSGAVAADQLKKFTGAAIEFEKAAGQSISKTVDVFKDLEKAPLEASVKLNNEIHYLTLSTYEQIKALDEQGKHTEAARLAQETYANSLASRTNQINQNIGSIERSWRAVTSAISRAGDEFLKIGRQTTPSDEREAIRARLAVLQSNNPVFQAQNSDGAAFGSGRGRTRSQADTKEEATLIARAAALDGVSFATKMAADEEAKRNKQVQAAIQFDSEADKVAGNREKRLKEIARIRSIGEAAGTPQAEINRVIAAAEEKYKDKSVKAYQDDGATKFLQNLRDQEATLKALLVSDATRNTSLSEQAKFEQQITDLKTKGQLTADQKSLLASADKIRAQLATNVSLERTLELQKAAAKAQSDQVKNLIETQNKADGIRRSIADQQINQKEQYGERLDVIGLGSEAAEQLRSRQQIENQYARFQRQLTEEAAKNKNLESAAYTSGTEDIKKALADALAANDAYYKAVAAKQSDWQLGASSALRNYAVDSANVFKQVESAVTSSFKGMEDALVKFTTTGKLDFKSLATSIIEDIVRIQVRRNITGPLSEALNGALGSSSGSAGNNPSAFTPSGGGGGLLDLFGSLFGGGRYNGGGVERNKLYQVGEGNKSELLTMRGKQYLIPGDNGSVQPGAGASGQRGDEIHYHFNGQTNRNELVSAVQTARALSERDRRESSRRSVYG